MRRSKRRVQRARQLESCVVIIAATAGKNCSCRITGIHASTGATCFSYTTYSARGEHVAMTSFHRMNILKSDYRSRLMMSVVQPDGAQACLHLTWILITDYRCTHGNFLCVSIVRWLVGQIIITCGCASWAYWHAIIGRIQQRQLTLTVLSSTDCSFFF